MACRGAIGTGTPGYDLYADNIVITDITDAKAAQDTASAAASAVDYLTTTVSQQVSHNHLRRPTTKEGAVLAALRI